MLLFVTNIVAIVLGTAAALWAIGIRPTHEFGVLESWVVRLVGTLVLLATVIAVYGIIPQRSLPLSLSSGLSAELAEENTPRFIEAYRDAENRLRIVVESAEPINPTVASRLQQVVQSEFETDVRVQIETRLVTTVE